MFFTKLHGNFKDANAANKMYYASFTTSLEFLFPLITEYIYNFPQIFLFHHGFKMPIHLLLVNTMIFPLSSEYV
jgi:hypothetical protein